MDRFGLPKMSIEKSPYHSLTPEKANERRTRLITEKRRAKVNDPPQV
jgi:hypothetical protein